MRTYLSHQCIDIYYIYIIIGIWFDVWTFTDKETGIPLTFLHLLQSTWYHLVNALVRVSLLTGIVDWTESTCI